MSRRPRQDVRHLKTPLACHSDYSDYSDCGDYGDYGDYNMQMETTPLGPNPCWAGAVQPRQLEMIALVAIDIIMKMGNLQTFLLSSVPNLLQSSS